MTNDAIPNNLYAMCYAQEFTHWHYLLPQTVNLKDAVENDYWSDVKSLLRPGDLITITNGENYAELLVSNDGILTIRALTTMKETNT